MKLRLMNAEQGVGAAFQREEFPPRYLTGANREEVWPLVRDFHYSGRMPGQIEHCYAARLPGGLFDDYGEITAAIVFSIPWGWSEDVLELSRLVRLPDHDEPLTRLIAFACGWLKRHGWCLLVSFADWAQKHHGGIYQASGWRYGGMRKPRMDGLNINGKFTPARTCTNAYGTNSPDRLRAILPDKEIEPHYDEGKHLYWRALNVAGKTRAKRLGLRSLPFPKPNAARPLDERLPERASTVQPCGAAPK
jgi:hypothetical protein